MNLKIEFSYLSLNIIHVNMYITYYPINIYTFYLSDKI